MRFSSVSSVNTMQAKNIDMWISSTVFDNGIHVHLYHLFCEYIKNVKIKKNIKMKLENKTCSIVTNAWSAVVT